MSGLGQALDRCEPLVPGGGDARHRLTYSVKPLGTDRVEELAPVPPVADEACSLQHRQMLCDGLTRHRDLPGEGRGRRFPERQQRVEQPPAGVGPDCSPERIALAATSAHVQADTSAFAAYSESCRRKPPHPFSCLEASSAFCSSVPVTFANPLSTTRSNVPSPSPCSWNSTSVKLPSWLRGSRSGSGVIQRKAHRWGGSTRSTAPGAVPSRSHRNSSSPPGRRSISAESLSQLPRCS